MTNRLSALFLALSLTAGTPLAAPDTAAYIPARDYLKTAEKEISAARSTIHLYLYLLNHDPSHPNSQPARLLQALIAAHNRGVKVDVLLNRATGADREGGTRNEDAAAYLLSQGIPAALTAGPLTMHAKVLVIDGRTLLSGSTNWSTAAFSRNGEGNTLIRSTAAARAAIAELGAFPRQPLPTPDPGIPVPTSFFAPNGPMRELVRRGDERGYDLYLYLLRQQAKENSPDFRLSEDDVVSYLGLTGKTRNRTRTHLLRDLKKLETRDALITLTVSPGQDPQIHMNDMTEARCIPSPLGRRCPEGADEGGKSLTVNLPENYFKWRWHTHLPMPAKVFYLLSLHHSTNSNLPPPAWSRSHETLANLHGVSAGFLMDGVAPLRRAGLLEVRYSPLAKDGSNRTPNIYTPRPLYDPIAREEAFQSLTAKYGSSAVLRARRIVALVYDDSDVPAVERFIQLEKEHGRPVVDQALHLIGAKQPTNPRRSTPYLIRTIETLSTESSTPMDQAEDAN